MFRGRHCCPRSTRGMANGGGGAGDRTRTYDPIITNDVLYQLSYTGAVFCLPLKTVLPV